MTAACTIADEDDGRRLAARAAGRHDGSTSPRRSSTSCACAARARRRSRRTSSPTAIPRATTRRRPTGLEPIREGEAVMFDFGAVHASGYSSDFGRTVVCGEPPAGYAEAYAAMLAAQEAGRAAAVPGAPLQRGQRRLPRADRGGRPRPVLPPPHGARHRARRARGAVHLERGRHAARAGHDVHGRAVDPLGRALRGAHRGHRRLRRGRRARAERVSEGVASSTRSRRRRPDRARSIQGRAARARDRAGLQLALRGLGRHDRRVRVGAGGDRSGADGRRG